MNVALGDEVFYDVEHIGIHAFVLARGPVIDLPELNWSIDRARVSEHCLDDMWVLVLYPGDHIGTIGAARQPVLAVTLTVLVINPLLHASDEVGSVSSDLFIGQINEVLCLPCISGLRVTEVAHFDDEDERVHVGAHDHRS